MKRWIALVVVILLAGAAYAHEGMSHIMGTVTAITVDSVSVKTTDGKTQAVSLNAQTKYAKGTSAISQKEITVGDHVVVHASKKGDQLIAAEIKVAAASGMHGDMSGMDMSHPKTQH